MKLEVEADNGRQEVSSNMCLITHVFMGQPGDWEAGGGEELQPLNQDQRGGWQEKLEGSGIKSPGNEQQFYSSIHSFMHACNAIIFLSTNISPVLISLYISHWYLMEKKRHGGF